jgi:hypothetical protein
MITKFDAIRSLEPTASFSEKDGVVTWIDKRVKQPSDAEIQAEIIRLQTVYDNNKYQRDRLEEYPSLLECVHAILDGELDALQAKRKIVKERHPKGGN